MKGESVRRDYAGPFVYVNDTLAFDNLSYTLTADIEFFRTAYAFSLELPLISSILFSKAPDHGSYEIRQKQKLFYLLHQR